VTVGGVLSLTVMVCESLAVLPDPSVAVNVRVMTRGLAGVPAPPLLDSTTVTAGVPQLSDAVACPAAAAGTSLAHWYVAFGGAVIVGSVVSVTVTV
jgi:hypothetical protein